MATPYTSDWIAFIESLNATQADYLIVGGCAVAVHGYPRLTGDLDILIRRTLSYALSSARSHALAIRQSRFAVSTETPSTSAVSSMFNPPK
jgi:hypothetical protein